MAKGKSKITAKRKTASNAKKITARRATIKKTLKATKVVAKQISAKTTTAKKKAVPAVVAKQKVTLKKAASKQKVTIASLEKIIAQTQVQLASLFDKEISQLTKQRDKIKAQLLKAQGQYHSSQEKLSAIQAKAGQKITPAIKLRLSKSKQIISKAERLVLSIEKQLTDVEKQLKPLTDNRAKQIALAIEVKAFEKQWGKAPIAKTATVSKPKSSASKAPAKLPKSSKPVEMTMADTHKVVAKTKSNPPITVEPILDDMLTDELLESTAEIETDTI
jgi:hypothetical protein